MDSQSAGAKNYDKTVFQQALLQSPRQFKHISDPHFSFSSVPPALPPKASSKTKLKPVTINFQGGSRVALSQGSQTTASIKPLSPKEFRTNYKGSSCIACTTVVMSTPLSGSSFAPVLSSSKLKPKPTFSKDYLMLNGNNNNSGFINVCDIGEDCESQIPNGLVSSRVARFSQKGKLYSKFQPQSFQTSTETNDTAKSAAFHFVRNNATAVGNYESINRTGPYDNIDLTMRYNTPSTDLNTLPPLPPKSYKSVKSSRTGTRVIPVSEGVTSPPPIFPRLPVKQTKAPAQDRGRTESSNRKQEAPILSRSLSAPSSPLLGRKFASGRSSAGTSRQKYTRNHSASSAIGRSPSPTRSEILPRTRRSISVSSVGSDDVGMKKAPSIRSLRDRFGSQSSVGSHDADQLEEDLRLLHEDTVNQKRKDQFAASREKKRLEKILAMCEQLVDKSKNADGTSRGNENLNQLLTEISIIGGGNMKEAGQDQRVPSPSTSASNDFSSHETDISPSKSNYQSSERTFRRLASLERDICGQTLPAERQGPALPEKLSRRNTKSPTVSPKLIKGRPEDVAEIQQLYEQGLRKMEKLKQRISELESQLEECVSALEMEKALVAGELESEQEKLMQEERICDNLKEEIIDLEENYMKQREIQNSLLEKEKKKLTELQEKLEESQRQLNNCPESIRDIWEEELKKDQTVLEQDLKNFEDIEFQTLENISRMDEDKELKQKRLLEDQKRCDASVKDRKAHVDALEKQMKELMTQEKENYQRLHSMRDNAIKELQEHREETSFLQKKYYELTGEQPVQPDLESSIRTKSQSTTVMSKPDDVSRHAKDISTEASPPPRLSNSSQHSFKLPSPIEKRPTSAKSDDQGATAAGEATSSTHCVKPYFQRLQDHRSVDQKPDSHRLKGFDVMSLSSIDSLDTTTSTAWSHCTPDQEEIEKIKSMEKQLQEAMVERSRLLAEVNAYVNKSTQEMSDLGSNAGLQSSSSSNIVAANNSSTDEASIQNPSTTSSNPPEVGASADSVVRRERNEPKKQTRPMTRYLPVHSKDFDLKQHIESSGHDPDSCRHVTVLTATCRGYLMKMSGRLRTWKKRWFVLDRQKKIISYFRNKHETKLRGMIYFQAIEDIFKDQVKSHRSPNPAWTFYMKCYDRTYSFVAPSSDAMRIWMDVLVTAAEGYTEYMKTLE